MANKKNITVEDLWALQRVGAPSLSPDGAQVVASVTRYDMDANKAHSSLWLLSTLGGKPRALTSCGSKDGAPRFSPQGDWVAFTAQRDQQGSKDSSAQLYLIAPDGGEAQRAADVATGVGAFKWCPGGKALVFVSWVWPHLKGSAAQAKQHSGVSSRKETGYATSQASYRHWDHNLPQDRVPHLLLLSLGEAGETGSVRDLFEGTPYELTRADPDGNQFDVSPDGRRVVFAFDPAPEKRGDGRFALAEMDIKTRRVQVLVQDPAWDLGAPRYNHDGSRIAFTASHQGKKHTMPSVLALWERSSNSWDTVSQRWDRAVHGPLQWGEDGNSVLFCAEDHGSSHLWNFDLATKRCGVHIEGAWVSAFDQAAGRCVVLRDSAVHPAQLVSYADDTPEGLRIESFNDAALAGLAMGRVEEVWFKGAQNDDVQMWLVYPPGFDPKKTYPVMHNIHGGPHTGPGNNWHYRWNTQLFAAQGYVVASVNYHGSSGFGRAFLDSITHRWGALELQDIEAATDWLLAQPWATPKRVFATGGSYGGYMVAWMNGNLKPGRYQAYVCHAGCFDWVGMFADDAWSWHAKELGAWYWNDMARVHAQSPHALAANFSTPTLVIHGALDYRVPDAQGLAYYNTLKARNVDSRLLWFPDENHWILKPQNSRQWYGEFFDWLKNHDPGARGQKRAGAGVRKARPQPTVKR